VLDGDGLPFVTGARAQGESGRRHGESEGCGPPERERAPVMILRVQDER